MEIHVKAESEQIIFGQFESSIEVASFSYILSAILKTGSSSQYNVKNENLERVYYVS